MRPSNRPCRAAADVKELLRAARWPGIPAVSGSPRYRCGVKKARIDAVLAERGLFPSRTAAAGAVRAGEVRVGADGPVALRPSQLVEPEAALIVASGPRFVSRGGIKLDNALEAL